MLAHSLFLWSCLCYIRHVVEVGMMELPVPGLLGGNFVHFRWAFQIVANDQTCSLLGLPWLLGKAAIGSDQD